MTLQLSRHALSEILPVPSALVSSTHRKENPQILMVDAKPGELNMHKKPRVAFDTQVAVFVVVVYY